MRENRVSERERGKCDAGNGRGGGAAPKTTNGMGRRRRKGERSFLRLNHFFFVLRSICALACLPLTQAGESCSLEG